MLELIKDIFKFIFKTKKLWLIPIFMIFILIGGILFYSSGSVIAPFLYTLF